MAPEWKVPRLWIQRRALLGAGWVVTLLLLPAPACRTPDRANEVPSSAPRERAHQVPDSHRFFIDPPRSTDTR